jgi:hypothetical protein
MSDEKALVPAGEDFFTEVGKELAPVSEEQRQAIQKHEQDGNKQDAKGLPLEFPRVEILHGGTQMFKFRDEDKKVDEFVGIIVMVEPGRVYWEKKFSQRSEGDDKWPDCFTRDLVKPDPDAKKRQHEKCSTCPNNQFGSDVNDDGSAGKGKACKEIRRVFFIPAQRMLPHWMMLPPSSLKALRRYFNLLENEKINLQFISTQFRLVSAKNSAGIEYSEISLRRGKELPESWKAEVIQWRAEIEKTLVSAQPVTADEYSSNSEESGRD